MPNDARRLRHFHYLEPPIHPANTQAALGLLSKHLSSNREWQWCDWQDLSAESPLKGLQCDDSTSLTINEDVPCSEIQFTGSFEEFWRLRSKDLRRNLRRYTDQVLLEGELQFNETTEADPVLLDTLIHLHAARWHRRGQPGMIEANGSAEFLRAVAAEFAAAACSGSSASDIKVKCRFGDGASLLKSSVWLYERVRPAIRGFRTGTQALIEALRRCHNDGYRAWNFLRGDEPYKFSWGAELIAKSRITLTRNG